MNDIWVGERADTGAMWVCDAAFPHEDPNWKYAFSISQKKMLAYHREQIDKMLVAVAGERREDALKEFQAWKAQHGKTFYEDERARLLKMEALARTAEKKRQEEAIARHKRYVEKFGKAYGGVSRNEIKRHRATHCYACKESLESSMHFECNTCEWLICYCGACGCGYLGAY